MNPIDKANELVGKYRLMFARQKEWIKEKDNEKAKQCAIIAVNEMINMCQLYHIHNVNIDTKIYNELTIEYWQEVKEEIEKL